jgi:hypothetical protein
MWVEALFQAYLGCNQSFETVSTQVINPSIIVASSKRELSA